MRAGTQREERWRTDRSKNANHERKYDITEEGEEETEPRPKIRDC